MTFATILAWALKHRDRFPVDVNTGEREMLLRVPGLGKRAVDRIILARRHATLRLDDVGRISAGLKRALGFLCTAHRADKFCTERFGPLTGDQPHAARRGMKQELLVRFDLIGFAQQIIDR